MRFPNPGQQAAQRAMQEAQRRAMQGHQQQVLRNMQAGVPAPKRGGCSTLVFLVFFLAAIVFIGYVVLHMVQFHW